MHFGDSDLSLVMDLSPPLWFLISKPYKRTYYYLTMEKIRMGGEDIYFHPKYQTKGNIILDSGKTATHLSNSVYYKVINDKLY